MAAFTVELPSGRHLVELSGGRLRTELPDGRQSIERVELSSGHRRVELLEGRPKHSGMRLLKARNYREFFNLSFCKPRLTLTERLLAAYHFEIK